MIALRTLVTTLTAMVALSGCVSLHGPAESVDYFPSKPVEVTWQVLNAVDYAQTVNTARRPDCGYYEKGWPTAEIIGQHPTVSKVEAMWALDGAAHALITHWLDREVEATDNDGWRAVRVIWHVFRFVDTTHNVIHNYQLGLRPFGAQCK